MGATAVFLVGVDVGGTRLRLRAREIRSGMRAEIIEIPVPESVDAMVEAIASLTRSSIGDQPIESVALGLPGRVVDNGCVWVPNLRFLDGVALGDILAARLSAPCHLINDAQATLLAEAGDGAARGCVNAMLIAVGTGIGGAFLVEGRLVRGANGSAGSFGWLTYTGSTRDEDHGQWERVGSGQALEQIGRAWGGTAGLIAAVRAGEPPARAALDRYSAVLGEGIAALASIIDPDVVVFAGGLSAAFELLRGPLVAAVSEHGSPTGRCVQVVPAALGVAAGVEGALQWAERCARGVGA